MPATKKNLKKTLAKLWKASKKEFDKMTKETAVLLKKGEKHLKEASHKSKEAMELINASLQREKVFYQLGKTVSSLPKTKWPSSKKVNSLLKEHAKLTEEIKKIKK